MTHNEAREAFANTETGHSALFRFHHDTIVKRAFMNGDHDKRLKLFDEIFDTEYPDDINPKKPIHTRFTRHDRCRLCGKPVLFAFDGKTFYDYAGCDDSCYMPPHETEPINFPSGNVIITNNLPYIEQLIDYNEWASPMEHTGNIITFESSVKQLNEYKELCLNNDIAAIFAPYNITPSARMPYSIILNTRDDSEENAKTPCDITIVNEIDNNETGRIINTNTTAGWFYVVDKSVYRNMMRETFGPVHGDIMFKQTMRELSDSIYKIGKGWYEFRCDIEGDIPISCRSPKDLPTGRLAGTLRRKSL